jgi:hypothetical protein
MAHQFQPSQCEGFFIQRMPIRRSLRFYGFFHVILTMPFPDSTPVAMTTLVALASAYPEPPPPELAMHVSDAQG